MFTQNACRVCLFLHLQPWWNARAMLNIPKKTANICYCSFVGHVKCGYWLIGRVVADMSLNLFFQSLLFKKNMAFALVTWPEFIPNDFSIIGDLLSMAPVRLHQQCISMGFLLTVLGFCIMILFCFIFKFIVRSPGTCKCDEFFLWGVGSLNSSEESITIFQAMRVTAGSSRNLNVFKIGWKMEECWFRWEAFFI